MRRSAVAVLVGIGAMLAFAAAVSAAPSIPLNAEQETTGSTGTGSGFFSYNDRG